MDMFAAETVQELKEKYPGIVLEMVSPFVNVNENLSQVLTNI